MTHWDNAIRSIASAMLDGADTSGRIAQLAHQFGVDVHTTTIVVEEMADLLK